MKDIDCVIFDLDGTLADTVPGIIESITFSLSKHDIRIPEAKVIAGLIGHPLDIIFLRLAKDQALTPRLIHSYRKHYLAIGIHNHTLYKGTKETLQYLRKSGFTMAIASNKPTQFGNIVLDQSGIREYFASIQFNEIKDGKDIKFTKADLIRKAIRETSSKNPIMVGDSVIDLRAGKEVGIKTIACAFNTAPEETLKKESPDMLIKDITELQRVLLA